MAKVATGGLGFGLERIGILVLRWPITATILMLISLVCAAFSLQNLEFDGNITGIVDRGSVSFERFERQRRDFRDYGKDVAVVIRSAELFSASSLEQIRNIHLELMLEDGVTSVLSPFSLGRLSSSGDAFVPALPEHFDNDAQATRSIDDLLRTMPEARSLIATSKEAVLLVVSLDFENSVSDRDLQTRLTALRGSISSTSKGQFQIELAGIPAIRTAVVDAIIEDQMTLTLLGILLGATVSYVIFRSAASALICTIPGGISVLWLLALFSLVGEKFNYVTTVLPSLALIIAFADGIVLYYRWQSCNSNGGQPLDNLQRAVVRVGPASALTSITTALAFLSFGYASGSTMKSLALFGVGTVGLAFLAVIVGMPLACYWLIRLGFRSQRTPAKLAMGTVRRKLPSGKYPMTTVLVSLCLLGLLLISHTMLRPSYRSTHILPANSEIRSAEEFINDNFGGTSQIFILVPVGVDGSFTSESNRRRMTMIDTVLSEILGAHRIVSLGRLWNGMKTEIVPKVEELLENLEPSQRRRFLSDDGRTMLVTISASTGQDTDQDARLVESISSSLASHMAVDDLQFTGTQVLVFEQVPRLIDQLRFGLVIAVFLAVAVIMIATSDWRLGIAALVPNLLPILLTESIILLSGGMLDITNVIALTIAFGIAIDNAVHVINGFSMELKSGSPPNLALDSAVREIAPALAASTVILCFATLITQFSSMPPVGILGRLLVVTLLVALASNLIILPEYIRYLYGARNEKKP